MDNEVPRSDIYVLKVQTLQLDSFSLLTMSCLDLWSTAKFWFFRRQECALNFESCIIKVCRSLRTCKLFYTV